MKELDLEQFEAELRQLRPAPASELWLDRVATELSTALAQKYSALEMPEVVRPTTSPISVPNTRWWRKWLSWGIPATAAALGVLMLLVLRPGSQPVRTTRVTNAGPSRSGVIQANQVEVDQELVAAFDAIAQLPDGEPVRFRCREWNELVTLHDSARGVVIERQEPRFVIVPIRFETY